MLLKCFKSLFIALKYFSQELYIFNSTLENYSLKTILFFQKKLFRVLLYVV